MVNYGTGIAQWQDVCASGGTVMRASAANHGFRVLSTLLRYDSGLCLWHPLCTMLLSPIFRLATCLVESESDSECGPGILQCRLKVAYQETHVLRYSKVERRSGSAIHLDLKIKKTLLVVVLLTVSVGSNNLSESAGKPTAN